MSFTKTTPTFFNPTIKKNLLIGNNRLIKTDDAFTDTKALTGGVNKSRQVKDKKDILWQLKPSRLMESLLGKLTRGSLDLANFGELVAAKIANQIAPGLTPNVELVYSSGKPPAVASEYLGGGKTMFPTLDDFCKQVFGVKAKHHVTFVEKDADPAKGEISFDLLDRVDERKPLLGLNQKDLELLKNLKASKDFLKDHGTLKPKDKNKQPIADLQKAKEKTTFTKLELPGLVEDLRQLKKDLCKAIALSALVGDHDINPGNMIVFVDTEGKLRIGRIDFGHALNDLIKHSIINGGEVRDKENPLLDFFNRAQVGGPGGAPSKLWRDYPGLIPCKEMSEALKELEQDMQLRQKIKEGCTNAKNEFNKLIVEMRAKNDIKGIAHVHQTMAALSPEPSTPNNLSKSVEINPSSKWTQLPPLSKSAEHISFGASSVEPISRGGASSIEPISRSASSGELIARGASSDENNLGQVFEKIEGFVNTQADNLLKTANVMDLQLAIDDILKEKIKITDLADCLNKELPKTDGKIHWVKSGEQQAEICTFEDFINKRAAALQVDSNMTSYIIDSISSPVPALNITNKFKSALPKQDEPEALNKTFGA